MSGASDLLAYNYADFRGDEDWDGFMARLHAGEKAPDATLTDLDGNTVMLSSLWRTANLLLEFGSYT